MNHKEKDIRRKRTSSVRTDSFHRTIKYEFHGPEGNGNLDAINSVLWSRGFRVVDLFAGIGGIRLGFESVGGRGVFASEWDTDAQDTYEANFGDRPFGDITKIAPEDIPDHDILLAGFPCQPFSIIGDRKGFSDTRGTLFFSIEEILRAKQPPAVLLENVKQFKTHDAGKTFATVIERLKELGYFTHTGILNALNYGVCQKRERTFIAGFRANIAFKFPTPLAHRPSLVSILEPDDKIEPKLWASEMIQKKRLERLKAQGTEPFSNN